MRNPAKEAWGLAPVATSLNASHSNHRFPTSRPAIDHPASQLAYTRLAALHAHTRSHARAESHIHTHTHTYTRIWVYLYIYIYDIYIYAHIRYPRAYIDTKHYADTQTHAGAPVHHTTPYYTQHRSRPHRAKTHTHTPHMGCTEMKAGVTVVGIN